MSGDSHRDLQLMSSVLFTVWSEQAPTSSPRSGSYGVASPVNHRRCVHDGLWFRRDQVSEKQLQGSVAASVGARRVFVQSSTT